MGSLDAILFERINRDWTSPFLDHFMPAISALDIWLPFLRAGSVALAIWGGKNGRLFLISVAIGLLLGDVLVSNTLKEAVGRVRPRDAQAGVLVRSLSPEKPRLLHVFDPPVVTESRPVTKTAVFGNSFPSSHVLNLFMLATVAFRYRRTAGLVLAVVALAVSWSRLYCGAHWPSDIPPSILLGIATGFASVKLVDWGERRFAAKWPGQAK